MNVDDENLKYKQRRTNGWTRRSYRNISVAIVLAGLGLCKLAAANEGNSRGAALYSENCMVCHGEDGDGAMPGVADLTENPTWSLLSEKELVSRIQQGIQPPGAAVTMPPRGGNPNLTDQDLLQIIRFMKVSFLQKAVL